MINAAVYIEGDEGVKLRLGFTYLPPPPPLSWDTALVQNQWRKVMGHSPIRQTFELGKFISTAGKRIINLLKNYAFPRVIEKYTKFANFTRLYFPHFTIFCNQTSQFY